MMTLDGAINYYEDMAYQKDLESGFDTDNDRYAMTDKERADCKECAEKYQQLAEWLKELKRLKEQDSIINKIKAEIEDLTYYCCEVHPRTVIDDVLDIIDKYKAEMESEE